MIVEATYVLCTSQARFIDIKEARHRDKVLPIYFKNYLNRMKPAYNVIMLLPRLRMELFLSQFLWLEISLTPSTPCPIGTTMRLRFMPFTQDTGLRMEKRLFKSGVRTF